ncbi:hypothetical protein SS50377_23490 [Spironucleus salmonicida]|uniref:Uncharacterized protein n=1 Tax=Spironucleus salmonicida TaxID=348837 RepID=V6LNI0_9EUKA|nr:hypothetical protein SS50377_23490 [Spironucleus salmonicida]|eukprot:EST46227.1 hypothetical protein SS50377_13823 [Spironucleus salmonicida]
MYNYKPHWPAILYDYRENGISQRALPEAKLSDISKICEYYYEQLQASCIDDRENMKLVLQYMHRIKNQAAELQGQDQEFMQNLKKVRGIQEEFEILKAGDLDHDPLRSPEQMHKQLLQVETDYNLLIDTIESYKRRILLLEDSLDKNLDRKLY